MKKICVVCGEEFDVRGGRGKRPTNAITCGDTCAAQRRRLVRRQNYQRNVKHEREKTRRWTGDNPEYRRWWYEQNKEDQQQQGRERRRKSRRDKRKQRIEHASAIEDLKRQVAKNFRPKGFVKTVVYRGEADG